MTTIAWDGHTLAADSREGLDGGVYHDSCKKIFKIGGSYIAPAGDSGHGLQFIRWCRDRTKEKPLIDDKEFDAIEITSDGKAYLYDDKFERFLWPPPIAIGSGGNFAIGAMLAGKTAKEAVKIAMKCDYGTGGKIQTVKIK